MAKSENTDAEPAASSPDSLGWLVGRGEGGGSSGAVAGGYFAESRGLALSFVLVTPVLLLYEIALVLCRPARPMGTRRWIGGFLSVLFDTRGVILLNGAILLFFLLAVVVLLQRRRLRVGLMLPVIFESAVWAFLLVAVAVAIHSGLRSVPLDLAASDYVTQLGLKVIGSVGAGLYEELLFRLVLTSVVYLAVYDLFGPGVVDRRNAFFFLVSGIWFGALYVYRGFGVAVYTHVIYDVFIYLSR